MWPRRPAACTTSGRWPPGNILPDPVLVSEMPCEVLASAGGGGRVDRKGEPAPGARINAGRHVASGTEGRGGFDRLALTRGRWAGAHRQWPAQQQRQGYSRVGGGAAGWGVGAEPKPRAHWLCPHCSSTGWWAERLADPPSPTQLCLHQCPPEAIACRPAHPLLPNTAGSLTFQPSPNTLLAPCPGSIVDSNLLPLLTHAKLITSTLPEALSGDPPPASGGGAGSRRCGPDTREPPASQWMGRVEITPLGNHDVHAEKEGGVAVPWRSGGISFPPLRSHHVLNGANPQLFFTVW